MIKFFRKIRQNLLSENKFSKYLIYAIGEIILVVIGILIALQINNWNENKKLDYKRQNYYNQLVDDLQKDKAILLENISRTDSLKTGYSEYLKTFSDKTLTVDQMTKNLFQLPLAANLISFNSSTFESLEISGDLKIIPEVLRNKLLDLNREEGLLEERIKGNGTIQVDFLKEYYLATGSRSLMENPKIADFFKNDINQPKAILALESNMRWKIATESSKEFKELLSEIDKIIELIKIELKK